MYFYDWLNNSPVICLHSNLLSSFYSASGASVVAIDNKIEQAMVRVFVES